MSRTAVLPPLFLGEGRFEFRLGIGELRQLEEGRVRALARFGLAAGEGSVEKVLTRLGDGGLLIDEVEAVLRLGLVGAGMDKEEAFDLVKAHVVPPDLKKCATMAFIILSAALYGRDEGEGEDGDGSGAATAGEPAGAAEGPAASAPPTERPAGASSSAKVRKPAGGRKTSGE